MVEDGGFDYSCPVHFLSVYLARFYLFRTDRLVFSSVAFSVQKHKIGPKIVHSQEALERNKTALKKMLFSISPKFADSDIAKWLTRATQRRNIHQVIALNRKPKR